MSNVPEGAQLSDDGQWWWDGNEWQPVADGGASSAAPAAGGAEQESGEQQSSEGGGGGDAERAAAKAAAGLPDSPDQLSADQMQTYTNDEEAVELLDGGQVEVLAMADEGSEQEGEELA